MNTKTFNPSSFYLFPIYDWNHKFFASCCNLWLAFLNHKIDCRIETTQYGAYYYYTTKEGVTICHYYKDDQFGHGSQACGNEIPAPHVLFPDLNAELDCRLFERRERRLTEQNANK